MRWIRPLVSMLIVVALLGVCASCTSDDSITGPSSVEPAQQSQATRPALQPLLAPAPSSSPTPVASLLGSTLQTVLNTVHLLTCAPQPYAVNTALVGPAGGTITVGAHKLVIPVGALSQPTLITAEQIRGSTNSVRFQPAGLTFAKPATLTLSYSNCLLPPLGAQVVYTDEQLRVLERILSIDLRLSRSVNGFIRHFSRYAVAY
jgi:hypothetical protein